MTTMTRKTLLKGMAAFSALALTTTSALADAEYTFRVSNVLSEQDVTAFGLNKFAEIVAEKSDGRVEIEVFHGGQLGSGVETFEAVKNGYLDFAGDSFANLATITPAFEIFHFPFLFESRAQMLSALNSDKVQAQVNSELADVGLVWFSTYEIGGPRNVGTSNTRIETAADLKGMKFRASRSPLEIGSHEAWGAAGVTVDWPGTPEAVRLGMVDGLTVPYASFYSAKFHEGDLINYILDLNFQNYALVIAANADKMAGLPADVRQILEDSAGEAQAWHVEFVSDYITQNIQKMKEAGVEIYSLPDAEYAKVRDMTVDAVWPRFIGQEGMSQEKLNLIRTESGEIGTDGWGYSLGN